MHLLFLCLVIPFSLLSSDKINEFDTKSKLGVIATTGIMIFGGYGLYKIRKNWARARENQEIIVINHDQIDNTSDEKIINISENITSNILGLPLEMRLHIADFLNNPSKKCLLFCADERQDEEFYYNVLLKKPLNDVIKYIAIDNLRLQQYELSPIKEIETLCNSPVFVKNLNSLYDTFITNP